MGLGKGFKKGQLQRLSKGLKKMAKQANTLLDETATQTTTETQESKNGKDANPISPSKTPSKKKSLSFVDMLNQAAENLQQGLEGLEQNLQTMQQYDYQVETSFNEATGEMVPKAVTLRDKKTGELISRTSQVVEEDGTLRVTSTGKAEAMGQQQHPLGGKQPPLPPEFPKSGTIETLMVKKAGDSHATVTCKVLDGPETGRTLEYRVREDSDGTTSYHLVRESRPLRVGRSLVWIVLALIGALVAVLCAAHGSILADSLCMPVRPHGRILGSTDAFRHFEAPWWAPKPLKPAAFGMLCGDRSRTAVEHRGQQLSILKLPEGDGKATVWLKKSGVTEGTFGNRHIILAFNNKVKNFVAPWSVGDS